MPDSFNPFAALKLFPSAGLGAYAPMDTHSLQSSPLALAAGHIPGIAQSVAAIESQYADVKAGWLEDHAKAQARREGEQPDHLVLNRPGETLFKGYEVLPGGLAVISVKGMIVPSLHIFNIFFGYCSVEALVMAFMAAAADDAVQGILLIVNSPGGVVTRLFDGVDQLVAIKSGAGKRVFAHANELAASAAYAIACVADRITLPRTGMVGSIGVLWPHMEISKLLEKAGYTPSIIRQGARKAEGHPFEPLTDAARGLMQAQVDDLYTLFADFVSARTTLTRGQIDALESVVLTGERAVKAGLATDVQSVEQAIETALARL